jgi:hypothetical protein
MMRLAIAVLLGMLASPAVAAEWTPRAWAETGTLDLRTNVPGEGEYWFPVWLVVLDDQVYVRLGTKAASRVEKSSTAPTLGVRIAGQQFDRVKGVPVPEAADRVAQAMREKYWSDIFVRYMNHPLTLRLVPE